MIIGAGLSAADAILNAQVKIFIKKWIYLGFWLEKKLTALIFILDRIEWAQNWLSPPFPLFLPSKPF
jgi:hypothetical protein